MFVALWEVFLEGFCVVLVVDVVAVGVLVLVVLARDVSAVGVLVLVVLASVVLSVGAAAVGVWPIIAAVVLNGPAAAGVMAVAGVVLGYVAELWGGEVVEGRSGVWVDGALRGGAGRGVVGWVDEDFSEEDGVEEFLQAGWSVWVGVEAVAVLKEGEGFFEAVFEVFAVGGQSGEFPAYLIEFASEAGLLGFEQVEGDCVGVVGFEKLGLLGFEFAGLGGEFLDMGVLAGVDVVEFEAKVFLDGAPLVGGDADVAVEVGNASVDFVDEDGLEGTLLAVALAVGTDEIGVDLAVSGFGVVNDEPAAALAAADGGFQVVVMDALAFAVAVLAENGLDALPSGLVDERLVRARVVDSLVGDDAAVIRVAQDGKELVVAERVGRPAGRGDSGQAVSGEMVSESRQRPTVGGVLGESLGDERAADRVDVDPAGLPALAVAALPVEIAKRGPADGPAGAGLFTEAFDDFAGEVA